jgi:hypothetical protein
VKENKFNQKGQVLLMVVLVSMIGLIIVTGLFLRIIKLTKTEVEQETHEEAYSASEEVSRQIISTLQNGNSLSEQDIKNMNSSVMDVTINSIGEITGISLESGKSFDISNKIPSGSKINLKIDSTTWTAGEDVLITVIYFNDNQYSLAKRLFTNCSSSFGDLNPSIISCSESIISYTANGSEKFVRIKTLGDGIIFNAYADNIASEYVVTTQSGETLSETRTVVSNSVTMPTLFDYVLFNGVGEITK